jgi:hypothetical protein
MLDLHSSPLLLEAQLAERRREIAALRPRAGLPIARPRHFRTALADLLAHLAFHLDRRAVGVVVARHPNTAGHG